MIFDLLEQASYQPSASLNDPSIPLGEAWAQLTDGLRTPSGSLVGPMTPELAVVTCAKIVRETVAELRVKVLRTMPDGRSAQHVPEDRVGRALGVQPCVGMNGYQFREVMTHDLLTWGNAYALKRQTNAGELGALQYIPASNVLVEPAANAYGKTYRVRDGKLGEVPGMVATVDPAMMFHLMWWSPGGIVGASPIRSIEGEVGLSQAQQQFAALFFGQGSSVSYWIKRKDQLSTAAMDRLRTSVERAHGGAQRAHRIGILDEDMDIVSTAVNLADLQLIEARGYSIARIAAFYGMTPDRLNIFDKAATFASLDATEIRHVKSAIQPVVERWEAAVDVQLLGRGGDWVGNDGMMPEAPKEDRFLRFELDDVFRGDPKTRAEVQTKYAQHSVLSANEIRAQENWNPIDDEHANAYYVAENLRPVSLPYPVARGGSVGKDGSGSEGEKGAEDTGGSADALAVLRPIVVETAKRLHVRASVAIGRVVARGGDADIAARTTAAVSDYYRCADTAVFVREFEPIMRSAAALLGADLDSDAVAEVALGYLARGASRAATLSMREQDNDAEADKAATALLSSIRFQLGGNQ